MDVKEIEMDCDEALNYVKSEVKAHDILDLSYNRVFTPGEVLSIETQELNGKESLSINILVSEDTITSSVDIDLEEIKDDLIELVHIPKNKDEKTIILINRCNE